MEAAAKPGCVSSGRAKWCMLSKVVTNPIWILNADRVVVNCKDNGVMWSWYLFWGRRALEFFSCIFFLFWNSQQFSHECCHLVCSLRIPVTWGCAFSLQSFSINLQSVAQRNWIIPVSYGFIYLNLLKGVSDWNKKNVEPLLMITVTSIHCQFCDFSWEGGNKKLWGNTLQLAFVWPKGNFCESSSLPWIGQ